MNDCAELKIKIERGDGELFRVFASGPSGEAVGEFSVPFAPLELENFVLRMSRSRSTMRRVESPELGLITDFGGKLFNALFQSRIRELYRESISVARGEDKGLRVTLALTRVPELMHLPWEYLYDEPAFLSISAWTPVVRYLELPRGRRPLNTSLPLRILAMVSSPTNAPALDVERERHNLDEALMRLADMGAVEITWLEDASLRGLQRALRRGPYHVFHYIGHGAYDHQIEDGVLLLEDEQELGRRVTGTELGTMLADHTSLRLAVLNACEGARVSSDDPFAGVASSLVQREIPAVVAMQFEITDRAAITFAGEFYSALADGYAVDAALAEARKAIYADHNDVEWGTPVLFMRVPDGRIFDLPEREEPVPIPAHASNGHAPPQLDTPAEREPDLPPPERSRTRRFVLAGAGAAAARTGRFVLAAERFVQAAVAAVAVAVVVAGIVFALAGGHTKSPTPPPVTVTTPQPRTPSGILRAAIPTSVRPTCNDRVPLRVPGPVLVRALMRAAVACEPGGGVTFAQYSLALNEKKLTDYFNTSRVNGQHLGAKKTTVTLCGSVQPASPQVGPWMPSGNAGHQAATGGNGFGRVLCYGKTPQWRIEWIDMPHRIYAFAMGTSWDALFRWWQHTAGPTHGG